MYYLSHPPMETFRTTTIGLSALFFLGAQNGMQAQVSEDFEDGDITNGTVWNGSTALFTVVSDGGSMRLRSNSPGAANYYLSTPSSIVNDVRWEFYLNLKFATSGANYADLYLMSSSADLSSGVNGYFLRIGGTQDRLELFRVNSGSATSTGLLSPDGIVNSSTNNPFRIRVQRDMGGQWTLAYDDGALGSYTTAGSVTDATFTTSSHFGIRIEQSTATSAIDNHFFDDIMVGPIPVDVTPPEILNLVAVDELNLDVLFNEPVEELTSEDINNYDLIPFNGVAQAERDAVDLALVHLTLGLPMSNGNTYTLTVNGVADLAGNPAVGATAELLYFVSDSPLFREVVINEFMADPSPVVGLPDAEYVELFNATADKYFDLAGWTFRTSSSTATLPTYPLAPGQHVVLVANSTAGLFNGIPGVLPLSSLPSLVNDGTALTLEGPGNVLLDQLSYTTAWYRDTNKDDGGWSLEQINPNTPCSNELNWRASVAPQGGTPGSVNSVLDLTPDMTSPSLVQALPLSSTLLELVFSEGMNAASLLSGSYVISPPLPIAQVVPLPPTQERVQLTLGAEMSEGVTYTITVSNVTDCPGNPISAVNSVLFAIPQDVEPNDVVVNEVLHNPITTGGEFVELYNRSDKVLSLQGWKMANVSDGVVANPVVITSEPLLFFPGEYMLLTRNPTITAQQFPLGHPERFITVNLPSYTNASGTVVVQDSLSAVLDLFAYDEDMHFPLLQSVKGVSLERQDPDRSTADRTNWHSASEYVGFGTPGYENSQFAPAPEPSGDMDVGEGIFSPDNDGYQDVLTITYRFDQPEFVGTMRVFDIAGREVQRLMDNELLGNSGAIAWDGTLNDGSLGRMGAYIIGFEVYDLSGNVQNLKRTVTLAQHLGQ